MIKTLLRIILFALLILPLTAAAQDDVTQSVDLGDGYTITIPASWEVKKLHDGAFTLGDDAITLTVTTPTRLGDLNIDFDANSNVVDVLINLALPFDGANLTTGVVQKSRYDNRPAALYIDSSGDTLDQLYAAVTLSDGAFGYLSFSGTKDDFAAFSNQIDDVIASFDSDTVITSNSAASGAPCLVSADAANSAQLRVGPGTNRGAISFLPANTDVTVTGRNELDDGSIWYQLDKSQAAPNGTAAAELWVNAEDVSASGDCEHVGDTSAPPIIPIAVAPPVATTAPGENPPPQGGASGDITPASGTWTLTLNATTNASCSGYQNVADATANLFDQIVFVNRLTVINQNSFNYAGDVYNRAPNSNTFTGLFSFEDGISVQLWITANSTVSMSGQATGNFTLDNIPCSFTTLFLMTHN